MAQPRDARGAWERLQAQIAEWREELRVLQAEPGEMTEERRARIAAVAYQLRIADDDLANLEDARRRGLWA